MAIQLIRQPGEISFSRNPMVFEMRTDMMVSSNGRKYVGNLTLTNTRYLTNGALMILELMGRELVFVFLNVIDFDNGYQLPCPLPNEPVPVYMARLVVALRSNYYLDTHFVMEANGNSISFVAVEEGADYTLHLVSAVPDMKLNMSQSGVNRVKMPNITILAELYAGDSVKVMSVPLLPDDSGLVRWDVSASLSAHLIREGRDRPNFSMPVMEKGKSYTSYYIRYTELYGKNQEAKKVSTSAVKHVLYGGFSKSVLAERSIPGFFIDGAKTKFLNTFFDGKKVIKREQPCFLYWASLVNSVAKLDVSVQLFYSDGTTDTYTAMSLEGISRYEKVIIPSGVDQLNAHLRNELKTIVEYDVVLKSGAAEVSEKVRYIINYKHEPYMRFMLYENGFGAYEMVYMHGKKSLGYEVKSDSAKLISIRDFVLADGEEIDFDLTIRETEKIFTGYKPKREIRALRGFFLSADKLVYKNGRYYPITLTTKELDEFEDGNRLYGLSFDIGCRFVEELFASDDDELEYSYAPNLQQYVPQPPVVEIPNFDDRYYLKTETYNQVEIDNKIRALQTDFNQLSTNVNTAISNQNSIIGGKADASHTHPEYVTQTWVYDLLFDSISFAGVWVQPVQDEDDEGYDIGNIVIYNNCLWQSTIEENFAVPGTNASWRMELRGGDELINDETVSYDDDSNSMNGATRYPNMRVGGAVWSKVNAVVWTKMSDTDWKVDTLVIK